MKVWDDHITIWNPGRLPQGLTIAKLASTHESLPQNPILANPVYLAGYIEQIGTGTTDIIDLCKDAGLRVQFIEDGNFTTIIYRSTDQVTDQVTGQVRQLILALGNRTLSRQEIMKLLSLSGRDNFSFQYFQYFQLK